MAQHQQQLGGRLALQDTSSLEGAAKVYYEEIVNKMGPWSETVGVEVKTEDGRLIGFFNPMLRSPEMGSSFQALQDTEGAHTSISDRVRQVVILAVGAIWQAPYELYAHLPLAQKAGIDARTATALADGKALHTLSPEEQTAIEFSRELVIGRRVTAHTYNSAHLTFGEKGLVDLIVLISCYQMVCGLLNAFEIPAPK